MFREGKHIYVQGTQNYHKCAVCTFQAHCGFVVFYVQISRIVPFSDIYATLKLIYVNPSIRHIYGGICCAGNEVNDVT